MQAAERDGRRPSSRPGRHADDGGSESAARQRHPLACRFLPRAEQRRHPVRDVRADRLRLLPELRRNAAAGDRAWRQRHRAAASHSAPATRSSTRRSRARRRSTGRATDRTTRPRRANQGSRERSRSSPATASRSSRAIMIKVFADVQITSAFAVDVDVVGFSSSSLAATRTTCTSRTGPTISGRRHVTRLRRRQSRRAIQRHAVAADHRPDQQPVRPALLHRRATRSAGVHRQRNIHRAAAAADRWRVPRQALDVLRTRRADPRVDRDAVDVLMLSLGPPEGGHYDLRVVSGSPYESHLRSVRL